MKQSKNEINQLVKDKESLQKKLIELKETLKSKDLHRDNLSSMVPLINVIKNIKKDLESKDQQINKIG